MNASLVLVDYANRQRSEGKALMQAVLDACVVRFRPIMLTSVTTFVGLIPLMSTTTPATASITASSRLAEASRAVMLPFFPLRKEDGSGYILRFDPLLENFPSGDDLEDATAINLSIEKFVRQHPEHYMWIHPRFRTRPPGEAPFYS